MFSTAFRISLVALLVAVTPLMVSANGGSSTSNKIEARLTATAASRLASGKAKFERAGARTKFSAEGEDLEATFNGKSATILVNGISVGTAHVVLGGFDLNLDSDLRQSVPSIKVGDRVSVNVGGVVVLNGTF